HPEPALPDGAKVRVSDAAPAAATPDELDAPAEASPDVTIDEAGEKASEESAPVDIASTPAGAEGEDDAESEGTPPEPDYDAYDEVEGLMPPPPRLRRGGFPRSMYPRRRRLVRAALILLAGLFAAGIVVNFRGAGHETRAFAPEVKAAAAREQPPPTTAPPTRTPPTTPDAGPPPPAPLLSHPPPRPRRPGPFRLHPRPRLRVHRPAAVDAVGARKRRRPRRPSRDGRSRVRGTRHGRDPPPDDRVGWRLRRADRAVHRRRDDHLAGH